MVTRRKVTKKKVATATAGNKPASTAAKRVSPSASKKKGVAAKRKPKATSNIFSLGESVVISEVMEWREKMAAAISAQDEVVLDGSEIERIDGTGLQLLVALMKEAVSTSTAITWNSASDVLLESAAQLGLTEILGLEKLSGANQG
jgi:anti-anti-sigma regulatory factor